MTLFLSEDTKVEGIYEGVKSGIIKAIKFYPQGVTTNSSGGIKNLSKIEQLGKIGRSIMSYGRQTLKLIFTTEKHISLRKQF